MNSNRVLCVRFRDPKYSADFVFPAVRLQGAEDPPNVLRPQDFMDANRGGLGRGRGRGGRGKRERGR